MRAKETESPPAGGARGHANPGAAPSTAVLTQPQRRGYATTLCTSSKDELSAPTVEVGPCVFGLTEGELDAEVCRLRRAGWKRWELIAVFHRLRLVRNTWRGQRSETRSVVDEGT